MLKIVRSALLLTSLGLAIPASAIDFGRAHLASAPGKPLRITIPVRDLSPQDLQSLQVRVASAQQWQQAGLKPPVALSALAVRVIDGPTPNTRMLELRADAVPSSAVIDVLLDVSSTSTQRLLQSSVISQAAPTVRLSGQAHNVLRGDTLFGVAQQFPVSGATLYQMLWALYAANKHAFISENMNLLKAGASLSIPSDAEVLAVNPNFARQQYLAHVQAFNAGRGRSGAAVHSAQSESTAQAKKPDNSGQVEASKPEVKANVTDRVQLSAANEADGAQAADQQTSQQHAQREAQARIEQLEKNIEALKSALAVSGEQNLTPSVAGATGERAGDNVATSVNSAQAQTGGQNQSGSAQNTVAQTAETAKKNGVTGDAQGVSDSAVEQVKQWVSDNVLAAGALFLALIALIFAWVMRSSAQRVASNRDNNPQVKAFEEQLKEIDLNLGDASAPAAPKASAPAQSATRHGKGRGGRKGSHKGR